MRAMQRHTRQHEATLQPVNEAAGWLPESWQSRTAVQQPAYPDAAALEGALSEVRRLPPLVTSWEVIALKLMLAALAQHKRFLQVSQLAREKGVVFVRRSVGIGHRSGVDFAF